jgi:itaconyl-CoA hydratase
MSHPPDREAATPIEGGGRCYEDFVPGMIIRHPLGRTITAADNTWFTLLTVNSNPIHFDAHYSAQTEFGRPLVNSTLTLALITGLSSGDVSRYAVNLGWDEVRMPAPLFEGDTLYAQSEVLKVRESESRPHMGLVTISSTGFKHDGTVVMEFRRTILVYKRGHLPQLPVPAPKT